MFQRLSVAVESRGEHVVLRMGSSSWWLQYEEALGLAWRMRTAARKAKSFTGEEGHAYSCLGTLHDAEKGPDWGQPFTPGGLYPVAREVQKHASAHSEGDLVVLKFGGAEAKIPYRAAQKIGQWIRLRAKESKRRAGDIERHWGALIPSE